MAFLRAPHVAHVYSPAGCLFARASHGPVELGGFWLLHRNPLLPSPYLVLVHGHGACRQTPCVSLAPHHRLSVCPYLAQLHGPGAPCVSLVHERWH